MIRGVAVWLALMAAEVLHGIARGIWLIPAAGDFRSRQIGVFTGSAINFAVTLACIRWIRPARAADAALVGVLWLALTTAFELVVGRLIAQASWERVLSDYDIAHGGLLPFGLVALALSPIAAAKLRRLI